MQRRDYGLFRSLGAPLTKCVKESRVLLVGAGGIGCELLKNLVTSAFGSGLLPQGASNGTDAPQISERKPGIVVVDLDTIDLSNLNRQFLFRSHHLKKPKSLVAKETASHFNPSVNIEPHHASIFDAQYNVEFYEGFDVVFNALDNLAARQHVNQMCLAANVPLVESGTTGFNGQVQAIKKGITECYDCNVKEPPKAYPICTIRSTPSQPIHCIVWAKSYLLPELFGVSEEDTSDLQVTEGDSAEEVAKLKQEAEALKTVRSIMGEKAFAQEVFNKVFYDDIERLQSMSEMWQSRKPPQPQRYESLAIDPDAVAQGKVLSAQDQSVWGLLDNFKVFCYSLDALTKRAQAGESNIEFDKDDKDTLDFVSSAANIRAHVFEIPPKSQWDIKQMAGNIIPAIATANALTASLCVLEAFKILRAESLTANGAGGQARNAQTSSVKDSGVLGGSRMVFLDANHTDRLMSANRLRPPRPDCPVCSPIYTKLALPKEGSPTVQQLVDLMQAGHNYTDLSITTDTGMVYDQDFDDNLSRPLSDFGVAAGGTGFITITDESDEPRVDLILSTTSKLSDDSKLQLVPTDLEIPRKPEKETSEANGKADPDMEPLSISSPGAGDKRKRSADDEDVVESSKKKSRADDDPSKPFIVEDDGRILLD